MLDDANVVERILIALHPTSDESNLGIEYTIWNQLELTQSEPAPLFLFQSQTEMELLAEPMGVTSVDSPTLKLRIEIFKEDVQCKANLLEKRRGFRQN